jgi:SpoVK/Ycf46/Vps4 family AAA+-type ATPase
MATIKAPMSEDVEIKKLAELTDEMTGADIERIVRSAEREWFYDYKKLNGNPEPKLGMEYFLKAIEKAKTSLTENERDGDASIPI